MKQIKIDISDVVASGNSVRRAIVDWASESDEVSSGVIGPSFFCSGPGSGWQRNHDENDYAARALADDYGAMAYVDCDSGRVATLDDEGDVVWSDDSEVEIEVPSAEDALRYPEALLAMAIAVRDHHHAASDTAAWRDLIDHVKTAGEKLDGVEIETASAEND